MFFHVQLHSVADKKPVFYLWVPVHIVAIVGRTGKSIGKE